MFLAHFYQSLFKFYDYLQALTKLENVFCGHDGSGRIYSRLKSIPYLQQIDSYEKFTVLNEGTAFLEVGKIVKN